MKRFKVSSCLVFVTIFSAPIFLAGTAFAASGVWNNASAGNWSGSGNWTGGVPNGSSDDATFPDLSPTVNVDGTFSVHDLIFNSVNPDDYDFTGAGGLLNLYGAVTLSADQDITMQNHLALQNDSTFTIVPGSSVRLNGTVSGSHGITFTGSGPVFNAGTASYSGTTTLDGDFFGSSHANVWSPNSDFVLTDNSGSDLSVCGGNQTIASLSGGAASHVDFCGFMLTLGNASDTTYAGTLQDVGNPDGGIIKQGSGKLTLTGANTYSGPTIVNAGTLDVNGSIAGSSVTVASGATLKGSGTLPAVTMNGTVAPGNSIGTLHGTSFTFGSGSTLENEINTAGDTDLVSASGSVTINSGAALKIIPAAGTYKAGATYTIISAPSITGTFSSITTTSTLNYEVKYYSTHVDIVITDPSTTVTAPSTGYGQPSKTNDVVPAIALLSVALIATGLALRNKSTKIIRLNERRHPDKTILQR